MARLVTVGEVIANARRHADQVVSTFISDAEALALFNEVYCDLYTELTDADEAYNSTDYSFTIAPGTTQYALPSDFYKLVTVGFATVAGTQRVTVPRINPQEINSNFVSTSNIPNGTVYLRYVPSPPIFTSTSQTIDGVAGWDRAVSLQLAIDMMDSEESNSNALQRKLDAWWERFEESLSRDLGQPATVTDTSARSSYTLYNNIKYNLVGGDIEFVSTQQLGAAVFGGPFG